MTDIQSIKVGTLLQDFLIYLCFILPIILLRKFVEPYHRGFFCDDESIRYPRLPTTISTVTMAVAGVTISLTIIITVEVYRFYKVEPRMQEGTVLNGSASTINIRYIDTFTTGASIGDRFIHPLIIRLSTYTSIFLFGGAVCETFIVLGKFSLGELRPFFIEACQPDWTRINCSYHQYITDYVCLTNDTKTLREARQSFPSSHAAFGAYCACFAIMYLRKRASWPLSATTGQFVRPMIQYLLIMTAFWAGVTRINDHQHHSWDVIAGFILGTLVATLTCTNFEVCCGDKMEYWYRKSSYQVIQNLEQEDTLDKETTSLLYRDKT